MDDQNPTQDVTAAPAAPQNEPAEQPAPQPQEPAEQPEPQGEPQTEVPAQASQPVEEDEEIEYPNYQLPPASPIDFSQLPVGEDNLIDPNALAASINQSIAAAEQRATLQAQQVYQEQRAEEKAWDKAFEKYPELKNNRDLRDMVQNARLGEITNLLSRTQDPRSVKLPTPAAMADKLFKYMGNAKAEGMKQATENTVVQQSAHIETAGRRTDDSADTKAQAYQNINNPNKEVAKKARQDLLKQLVFGNE